MDSAGVERPDNFRSMPPFGEDRGEILPNDVWPFVPDSNCPIVEVTEPDLDRLGVTKRDLSPSQISGED